MKAELFRKDDYPTYARLLEKRGRPVTPFSFLPPTGVKITNGEEIVAAGFLAKTDTPIAAICDLVTNPESVAEARDLALSMLIGKLEELAVSAGYSATCASTNHRGLEARYVKMGYMESDKGLSLFVRFVCQQEG